jgi:hypothetical protein
VINPLWLGDVVAGGITLVFPFTTRTRPPFSAAQLQVAGLVERAQAGSAARAEEKADKLKQAAVNNEVDRVRIESSPEIILT